MKELLFGLLSPFFFLLGIRGCYLGVHTWTYDSFAYYDTRRYCGRCGLVQRAVDSDEFLNRVTQIIEREEDREREERFKREEIRLRERASSGYLSALEEAINRYEGKPKTDDYQPILSKKALLSRCVFFELNCRKGPDKERVGRLIDRLQSIID